MDIRTGDLVAMETLGDELVDPSVLSCRRCLAIGESTLGQLLRVTSVSSFPTLICAVVPTDSSLDAECDRGPPCSLIKEFKLGENDSGVESLSNSSGSVVKPSYWMESHSNCVRRWIKSISHIELNATTILSYKASVCLCTPLMPAVNSHLVTVWSTGYIPQLVAEGRVRRWQQSEAREDTYNIN